MSGESNSRGFTLLEFLFAASLLAVLTAVGLFAIGRQSKTDFFQKDMSEMDHVAYSILEIISLEIKNAGSSGGGASPIFFVDGGGAVEKSGGQCDTKSAKENGTDCITLESLKYGEEKSVKKSFFVKKGVLKLRNSDSSRTQSLTSGESGVRVEDFQIGFLTAGGDDFRDTPESGATVEAVKTTLTLKSRGSHGNKKDGHIRKTYSAVTNPRNI